MERPRPLTFADLASAQQQLLRVMQRLHHGRIGALYVRGGVPVFSPTPILVRAAHCTRPRRELAARDFSLKAAVLRLLEALADLRDGRIDIEILDGLPHRWQATPAN